MSVYKMKPTLNGEGGGQGGSTVIVPLVTFVKKIPNGGHLDVLALVDLIQSKLTEEELEYVSSFDIGEFTNKKAIIGMYEKDSGNYILSVAGQELGETVVSENGIIQFLLDNKTAIEATKFNHETINTACENFYEFTSNTAKVYTPICLVYKDNNLNYIEFTEEEILALFVE